MFFSARAVSNFWRRILRVENVLDPDTEACRLVGVGGTDSSPGRPDLELPEPPLAGRVDRDVPGHDQVRVSRDPQPGSRDPAPLELVDLLDEEPRVDDAACSDDADLPVAEDARGHVVELEGLAVADDRVPGVRTALVPADEVGVLRQEIHDLPLAFVPPLGPDDDGRWHRSGAYSPHRATRRPYAAARSENFA